MNKSAKFWNFAAKRYANQPIPNEDVYKLKLERTQELLKPSMHLLEFGCGTGMTALIHAQYVEHIHAIDFSPKMIDIAKLNAHAQQIKNVTFEVNTLDKSNALTQEYDMVLGLNVLHLLDNWQDIIGMINKILPSGGYFVSSTHCMSHMKIFRYVAKVGNALGVLPSFNFFSEEQLKASLTHQGFIIEEHWRPNENSAAFIIARKI